MGGWLLAQAKELLDVKDSDGWTPLIIACSAGHTELVLSLLEGGADINATTSQGRSSLLYAASKGRSELCSLLLARGGDPLLCDVHGVSPLHRAAGPGHSDVVRMLLASNQANRLIDLQDRFGNSALHLACEEERSEVAQLLISHGANREIKNKEEKTPLELCTPGFARSLRS